MTAPDQGLCESCRELKPIAWADTLGREFCEDCLVEVPTLTPLNMIQFLLMTIPFHVGDRVECRTAGVLYDGIGTIVEVSIDPEKFGTPVFPSFNVHIEEKAYDEAPDSRWYMEPQLRKVSSE